MTDREELEIAVKALDSKKATKITALKVEDLTILANYFVIASASSTTQVKALA
ncbi:MAG: RsfS/YbeB/iojap family protein, partial [Oscillospiraceae bacterium]